MSLLQVIVFQDVLFVKIVLYFGGFSRYFFLNHVKRIVGSCCVKLSELLIFINLSIYTLFIGVLLDTFFKSPYVDIFVKMPIFCNVYYFFLNSTFKFSKIIFCLTLHLL